MKKTSLLFALAAFITTPALAQTATVVAGKPIFQADGKRLGVVYKVTGDGSAQLILNGKMVTVPAATITTTDGKYTTSLTKKELAKAS